MKKRILSMLLCIIMCAAMLPFSAMATDAQQPEMPEDGGEGIAPYTVDPALAEASVTLNGDTVYYATIEEALPAAQKAENKGCLLKLENNAVLDMDITISGGTFTGTVMNKVGSTIKNGTFESTVTSYGTIENGVFKGEVTNGGTITGGTFKGVVTCQGNNGGGSGGSLRGGTVSGGSFDKTIRVIFGTIIGAEYSDWVKTRD